MNFFVPPYKTDEVKSEEMFKTFREHLELNGVNNFMGRLYRLEYSHNGKEYNDCVGEPGGYAYPQTIVLAIVLTDRFYVVYTLDTCKAKTGLLMVGFNDVIDYENFDE